MIMIFRKLVLFICLMGVCSALFAQGLPQLTLTEKKIDKGSFPISEGTQTFLFHYRNTGDAPLLVSQMVPSCVCVVPEFSKEPLAPGDSTTFSVRYTPPHTGNFSQLITIISNGEKPVLRVYIRGIVTEAEEKKPDND